MGAKGGFRGAYRVLGGVDAHEYRDLRARCRALRELADATEQYMAAARDTSPIYFERYMIDRNNRPADIQQMAQDRIHWFFSLDPAGRRQYSEDTATNVYYEQVATHWGNWAKVFFNNKGVVAKATDVCLSYPAGNMQVWDFASNS